MVIVMLTNEKFILRVTNWLVYPLIAILFGLSLYLIPHWTGTILTCKPLELNLITPTQAAAQSIYAAGQLSIGWVTSGAAHLFKLASGGHNFISTLWLTIPVLVFAFNHSPAISSSAVSHAHQYPDADATDREISKTLRLTAAMLVGFVMLFVFSCVLTLSPTDLALAKEENITVLSYLANQLDNPVISYFAPFVAFLAISSSFFGHYFGAREGFEGLINQFREQPISSKAFQKGSAIFFMATLWIAAILNPSILGFIESLSGPVIAMILFIMPMYAIRHVPALQRFRGAPSNVFVVVMGSIAISAVVYKLF